MIFIHYVFFYVLINNVNSFKNTERFNTFIKKIKHELL